MKKMIFLTVGLPDTGKTTFCHWLNNVVQDSTRHDHQDDTDDEVLTLEVSDNEYELDYCSTDLLIDSYATGNGITYAASAARYSDVALEMFFASVKHCVANGTDVIIIDRHNLTAAGRKQLVYSVRSVPYGETYQIVCLDFTCSDETRAKRRFLAEERGKIISEDTLKFLETLYEPPVDDDIVYADIVKINEENFDDMVVEMANYLLMYLRT